MHDATTIPPGESNHTDDALEPVFRALADPTRRAILDRLRAGRATTSDLAEAFPRLTRFAVMKHLTVLEEAGLVLSVREGRSRWNALNPIPLRRLYERWVTRFADLWAGPLLALERLAEQGPHTMDPAPARIARIDLETTIRAARVAVFRAFAERTHQWFFADEHPAPGAPPYRIEPRLGGRLFEDRGAGHGITLATITHYLPHTRIVLSGQFGARDAAHSTVSIDFADTPDAHTTLTLSHHILGAFDDTTLDEFRVGWRQALNSLASLLERD